MARDAMPAGGKVSSHTANYEIGPQEARTRFAVPAGPMCCSRSPTRPGHDRGYQGSHLRTVLHHQGAGKGTGLGMSTVYAIVQRGGGEITVSSQPTKAPPSRLPAPRRGIRRPAGGASAPAAGLNRGSETVLLVEDEDGCANWSRVSLSAATRCCKPPVPTTRWIFPSARRQDRPAVTDVVMPQMSGRVLAERLAAARPDMSCSSFPAIPKTAS